MHWRFGLEEFAMKIGNWVEVEEGEFHSATWATALVIIIATICGTVYLNAQPVVKWLPAEKVHVK